MSVFKKKLFWYRVKLFFIYVKIGLLLVLLFLWLFSPGILGMFLCKFMDDSILGYIVAFLCIAGIYFNFGLSADKNFLMNKWYNKLDNDRKKLRYAIYEEKNLITKVGNISILPFGKD